MEMFSKEELEQNTVAQLKELAESRNSIRGVEAISFASKVRKDDLISLLLEDQSLESTEVWEAFVGIDTTTEEISLSDVGICPLNPRRDLDYLDPLLMNRIQKANGLTKSISVVDATLIDENPTHRYYAIAGNRSIANLKEVVENVWQMKVEEYKLTVDVRHYTGTHRSVMAQILSEIEGDNDAALDFSPIDQLDMIKRRLEMGLSQSAIAKERQVSPATIGQLLKLDRLPKRILDLVHYEYRKDFLSRKTPRALDQAGVPFHLDKNGNPVIKGVTQTNAIALADMFPKPPFKTAYKDGGYEEAYEEWQDLCERLGTYCCQDEFIEMLIGMSADNFKSFGVIAIQNSGLLPESTSKLSVKEAKEVAQASTNLVEVPEKEEQGSTPDQEVGEPESVPNKLMAAAERAKEKAKKNNKTSNKNLTNSRGVPRFVKDKDVEEMFISDMETFCNELKGGNVDVVDGWQDAVAIKILNGDPEYTELISRMIALGIMGSALLV